MSALKKWLLWPLFWVCLVAIGIVAYAFIGGTIGNAIGSFFGYPNIKNTQSSLWLYYLGAFALLGTTGLLFTVFEILIKNTKRGSRTSLFLVLPAISILIFGPFFWSNVPKQYCIQVADLEIERQDGKLGFVDRTGNWVIRPQFEYASPFANGLASAVQDGKRGFIDRTGNWVIRPQFEFGGSAFTANGLASAVQDGKFGFIDRTGNWVIRPKFYGASRFANGLASAQQDGNGFKYGFIDRTGNWVIRPQFEFTDYFAENGLAAVVQNGEGGFINRTGNWVIRPQFEQVRSFAENGLAHVKQDGKWGYIDRTGNWVIRPQFEIASTFEDGLAYVRQDGKWDYIDDTGKTVPRPPEC